MKALLRPEALARLSAPSHRLCLNPSCPIVYFGGGEVFQREDVAVPVFQKEPAGNRTVCYCFAVSEVDLHREIADTGRSTAAERIVEHVKAGRCACELKNPQGSCCLGHVVQVTRALLVTLVLLAGASSASLDAQEIPVRVGQAFPALVLPALADGSPLAIERFRGRKVLLHQFASW